MPVGPSYRDCSADSRASIVGSSLVIVTGIGRVCGTSASRAPTVTSVVTPSCSASSSSSIVYDLQRIDGSMPSTMTTSRSMPGMCAHSRRVVGQVTRRWPSSSSPISGRFTWKS